MHGLLMIHFWFTSVQGVNLTEIKWLVQWRQYSPTKTMFNYCWLKWLDLVFAKTSKFWNWKKRSGDFKGTLFIIFQMTEQRKQKQRIGLLGHAPHMNINPQQPAWRWMWHAGLSSPSAVSLPTLRLTVYRGRCSYKEKKNVLVSHVPLGASMKCTATRQSSLTFMEKMEELKEEEE